MRNRRDFRSSKSIWNSWIHTDDCIINVGHIFYYILTHFMSVFYFYTPWRQTLVLWCLQGVQKWNISLDWTRFFAVDFQHFLKNNHRHWVPVIFFIIVKGRIISFQIPGQLYKTGYTMIPHTPERMLSIYCQPVFPFINISTN